MSTADKSPIRVMIGMTDKAEGEFLRDRLVQNAYQPLEILNVYDNGSQCLVDAYNAPHPDVLIAEDILPGIPGVQIAQTLRTKLPWVSVLVLTRRTTTENETLSAMEAGAAGYLRVPTRNNPAEYENLHRLILRVGNAARERRVVWEDPNKSLGGGAHVIAVYGPKGGVGRTVIAAKLANLLAQSSVGGSAPRVALCELGVPVSDLQPLLGANPPKTVRDLTRLQDEITSDNVLAVLQPYPGRDNLKVLYAPRQESEQEPLTAKRVSSIVFGLRPHYDYMVVDTGAGFSGVTKQVLRSATQHVLVTTPDLLGFENTKLVFRQAQTMGKPTALVINRFHKSAYKLTDIAAYIGASDAVTKFTIDDEPSLIQYALDSGELLRATDPKALSFTRTLNELSKYMVKTWPATSIAPRSAAYK